MICLLESRTRFWDFSFGKSRDGYSLMVNASGASIRSSFGYESPAKARFDYSFGRLMYVWINILVRIRVMEVSSKFSGVWKVVRSDFEDEI